MKGANKQKLVFCVVIILLLGLMGTACTGIFAEEPQADLNKYQGKTIFMHVGSPLILAGEEVSFLDSEDFDLAATLYNKRVLVPLRAVSEYLGGLVAYNEAKGQVTVSYMAKEFVFPIGKAEVLVKESGKTEKIKMDSQARIINNRTMVPLRIISEELFSKRVDYNDGVIMISDQDLILSKERGLVSTVKSKIGHATKAKSEEQLMALMESKEKNFFEKIRSGFGYVDIAVSDMSMDGSARPEASVNISKQSNNFGGYEGSSTDDYAKTNVQVEGIDEADIVKTDGSYIYYAGNNAVRIIRAEGSRMAEVSSIRLDREKYVQEIYLDEGRLILVGNREGKDGKSFSYVDIYDVSDPSTPGLLKGHEMEGYYQTSRKSGDQLYLITGTGWHGGIIRPLMKDTVVSENYERVDLSDIMVMPQPVNSGYIILSAIDIRDNRRTEVEAITAHGSTVYMNESALYLATDNFDGTTNISKFAIDGMNIGYGGSGKVKGTILNQFSMDEYEGKLRLASSLWEEGNNLFVLDESLNIIGSVTGLAKGETIYSARFVGDKAYVVTFRTIDPLFVFDLSNPAKPIVTGELEIPGFSNYLHPVGEDLILGIGMDTREVFERDAAGNETIIGVNQGGLKVSLFDVSDMGKPREISNYIVGDSGSHSEALYNHKAVMVDSYSQQIAFDASIVEDKGRNYNQGALVISYKDRDIKQKAFLKAAEPEVYGRYIPSGCRIIYIGDSLYYIQNGLIDAFDYETFEKTGSLALS